MLRHILYPFRIAIQGAPTSPVLQTLLAAEATAYYCRVLRGEGGASPEERLGRIEPISPDLVLRHPEWFRNATGGNSLRRLLRPAFYPEARIAVLDAPHIAPSRRLRHFRSEQWERLVRLRFEVLAAPIDTLLGWAGNSLPRLTHGVVALTRLGGTRLDETARHRLWATFQVPVFEQLEWFDGSLLAEECDAHSSLHLRTEDVRMDASESGEAILTLLASASIPALRVASGYAVDRGSAVCACGEVVPRLIHQPVVARAKAAAASA